MDIDRRITRWKAIGEIIVAGWVFLFMGTIHLSERIAERKRRRAMRSAAAGKDEGNDESA